MRYLLTGFLSLFLLTLFNSCQKEVSVEFGVPAKGSLQGDGGDCLPKTVAGTYIAGKAFADSNFIEVTVDVLTPGPYTVATDTLNGYSFKATGTFSAAGTNTVRLKGSGTPTAAGVNNFTVLFDSSFCEIAITVSPAGSSGSPATFTLVVSPTGCTAFDRQGNYIKDTALNSTNRVGVQVNVTATGTYTIATNTLNGYSFSATGTFSTTGVQTVFLQGTGKPVAAQIDNFTVTAGTLTCAFQVTVLATVPSPCGITAQGTYTTGTALSATNKVVLTHTYSAAGNYTVTTGTTNGYSFTTSPSPYAATAGSNTITLNAVGTPTAAGTNTFTVNYDDGTTCTFSVTVVAGTPVINTDYFPLTTNNWWSYNYTGASPSSDTLIMKVTGPTTVGGMGYQRFEWSSAAQGGAFAEYFYRKDASTGYYYEGIDTAGFGPQAIFTNTAALDINFLRNTLTTGQTWNSTEYPVTLNITGYSGPSTLRFKFTCDNNNATLTSATGGTITNVYQITSVLQANIGGLFVDVSDPIKTYYAKGIGQVKYREDADPINIYEENIRYWKVN
ncbi:MAG: hypothetical protein JWR72_1362 [Flavisolibacter sp.]|nr:hypothetical protein [Flavisolibacter sp.]